tara:strand:+ start:2063 stop:2215 length:153 start_codon:yes stop_codon:yes gene_type:complete
MISVKRIAYLFEIIFHEFLGVMMRIPFSTLALKKTFYGYPNSSFNLFYEL